MSVLSPGNWNGESSANKVAEGVYAKEVEILEAKDLSKQEILGKTYDLAIEMTVKNGEYDSRTTIKGNLQRDGERVTGWGSAAFSIDKFLKTLGIYEMFSKTELDEVMQAFEQSKVPLSILRALKGKKFWMLSYVAGRKDDGKLKYSTYTKFDVEKDKLVNQWKKDRENGFPSNYDPTVLDSNVTFAPPVEAEQKEGW